MTTRRRFIGKLTSMGSLIGGAVFFPACEKQTEHEANTETPSPDQQRRLLDAFVDTIVPRDRDPGGVEAGIPDLLQEKFGQGRPEGSNMSLLLVTIDRLAQQLYGAGFAGLSIVQREEVIAQVFQGGERNSLLLQNTLVQLRSWIIRAFYVSETGQKVLGYKAPYPDGYPDFNSPPPA